MTPGSVMGSPGPQSLNDSDHQLLRDNIGIRRPGTSKSHLQISRGAEGFSGVSVVMALSHFRCEEPKERIKSFRRAATEQALLSRLDVNLKPVSSPSEFSPLHLWGFFFNAALRTDFSQPRFARSGRAQKRATGASEPRARGLRLSEAPSRPSLWLLLCRILTVIVGQNQQKAPVHC